MTDHSENVLGLKMDLQMLEEERRREKEALESVTEKSSEDYTLAISQRDTARAECKIFNSNLQLLVQI
ncbi:hypothetical protein QTG54_002276 [Skeletonema marinoi]|uniref:Uncharacterized protein n=1 Tax=Skeletonema marinoi TaxID=267567 RepID=A0AAD8YKH6_9STRA|nr:hypothetical protein QTG54_002276 [Skeletonema marinoi]